LKLETSWLVLRAANKTCILLRQPPTSISKESRVMSKKLLIAPPALMRWQDKNKVSNVVFLDLNPDFLDDKTMRIDLEIAFNPIPIKRGWLRKKDYYVGSTGARVTFEAIGGRVRDYTRGTFFKVDYENTYKRSQHSAVKMAPKIEVEPSTKIELGEVSLDKDEERTYVAKFSGSERMLSDVNLGNRIEWELAIPPGQVLRQYLMGNLYLYVESVWDKDTTQGRVILRPSDISFFDSQRRLISGVKTGLAMLYKLYQKGIKVNKENVEVNFTESI
jgi:hypothetical protein